MKTIKVRDDRREAVHAAIGRRWEWWPGMQAVDCTPELPGEPPTVRKLRVERVSYRGGGGALLLEGWRTQEDGTAAWGTWFAVQGDPEGLDLGDRTTLAALQAQGVDLEQVREVAEGRA